jgi:predicted transcriptional regulator
MSTESYAWQKLNAQDRSAILRFQGATPVDLAGLARHFGLAVKAATLEPGKSGEIRPDGQGGYVIKINRHDSLGRQRFTVAHEIAHFLLHRELIGTGIEDDALYRSNQSDQIEWEANRLAADIVMPTKAIQQAIATAEKLGITNYRDELADRFQVSRAAMAIKLGMD